MAPEEAWNQGVRGASRARRIRLAQLLGVAAILLLGATLLLRSLHPDEPPVETGAALGYREHTAPIDDAPFALAEPDHPSDQTTTPSVDPSATSSTTTTTTAPIPTTTTKPPGVPLPDPGSDPICRGTVAIGSLAIDVFDGKATAIPEGLPEALFAAVDIIDEIDDPRLEPLRNAARQTAAEVAGARTLDQVRQAFQRFVAPSDPEIKAALGVVYAHTAEACPGLTGQM